MPELQQLLDDGHLGALSVRSVSEIRGLRTDCIAVETGLSYLRRMIQGRLDIVAAEQERRRVGGDPADLPQLIGQLPEIFSEQRRPGGVGRLPSTVDVPEVDDALADRLDTVAGPGVLARLTEHSDGELAGLFDQLSALEHEVSGYRRAMFERIDALQAELTDRYRTGEADVDALLADS